MDLKKNDEIIVEIEDMSENGEGIGHVNGLTLFVKDALIGDLVRAGITKVKKTYCYARTIEILEKGKDRTEPPCRIHRKCGGCQLQALSYEAQLRFKRKKVLDCFTRIGGFKDADSMEIKNGEGSVPDGFIRVEKTLGMENPWNYRNKAQFPVGRDKEGKPVFGFYAGRTHTIIPTDSCHIEFEGHEKILEALTDYINESGVSIYNEADGSGLLRHVLLRKGFATGEIMVVLVINGKKIKSPELLVRKLRSIESEDEIVSIQLNINTEKTNVILGRECITLYGRDYIEDMIGDIRFRISALSFYQVNPAQTRVLYGEALNACLGGDDSREKVNKTVWDMYCGIGTISLFLAKHFERVFGVEIIPQAIENAKENARLNGISNTEFFVGAAEEVVPDLYKKEPEKYRADIVVVDPPRKGCDEQLLETIVKMSPERVIYVSCDPATLARDCRFLADNGYMVKKVQPVDMFPHSGHVESCVLLERVSNRKADSYVKLNVKMEDYYRIKDSKGGEADG